GAYRTLVEEAQPVFDDTGKVTKMRGMFVDVTEHRKREVELESALRRQRLLANCTNAILHFGTQEDLLREYLRVLGEIGGFDFAWVSMKDGSARQTLKTVAARPEDYEFIDALDARWDWSKHGRNFIGEAVRSGNLRACNQIRSLPAGAWGRKEALEKGFKSAAAVPLNTDDETLGAIVLYSREEFAFEAILNETLKICGNELGARLAWMEAEQERNEARLALKVEADNNKNLSEIIRMSSLVAFRWRPEEGWPIDFVSDNVTSFGYSPQELEEGVRWFARLVHPADVETVGHELTAYLSSEDRHFQCQYRLKMANGEYRWVEGRGWAQARGENEVEFLHGVLVDIHEEKMAQQSAEESSERLQAFFDGVDDAAFIVDAETGIILDSNRRTTEMFGWPKDRFIGSPYTFLFPQNRLSQARADFDKACSRDRLVFEKEGEVLHRNGHLVPVTCYTISSTVSGRKVLQGFFRDRSEVQQVNEKLRELSERDSLTKVLNRSAFSERLQEHFSTLAEGEAFGFIILDVDHQKEINDGFGRDFGDEVLKRMARRLRQSMPNAILGRTGGDEFSLILPDSKTSDGLERAALRLQDSLSRTYNVRDHTIRATVSLGGTVARGSMENIDELLGEADGALTDAKMQGRNIYRAFSRDLSERFKDRAALRQELRQAIDNREFVAHLQPQFDISSGDLVGLEALARWSHPERGLVGPGEFISLAEGSDLILPLGALVFEDAVRQFKSMRGLGLLGEQVKMAVNLAPTQFRAGDLEDELLRITNEAGIAPKLIELEITERLLEYEVDNVLARMERLQDQGFSFVLDDFGTGFASFHNLDRLPLSKLKIPREFIKDIETNTTHRHFVRIIAEMSQELALDVVAEGIETEAQANMAMKSGCRFGQGFLFARPMSAEQLPDFLRERSQPD
ncbi:MAG: EAL domain-containing protein, partial [Alphaproteobacteria bacterium]|nr:EAL domain-containing protein [Alphaproteobacteria bacterium]